VRSPSIKPKSLLKNQSKLQLFKISPEDWSKSGGIHVKKFNLNGEIMGMRMRVQFNKSKHIERDKTCVNPRLDSKILNLSSVCFMNTLEELMLPKISPFHPIIPIL